MSSEQDQYKFDYSDKAIRSALEMAEGRVWDEYVVVYSDGEIGIHTSTTRIEDSGIIANVPAWNIKDVSGAETVGEAIDWIMESHACGDDQGFWK